MVEWNEQPVMAITVIFAAIVLLAALAFAGVFNFGTKGSVLGGTVVGLSPVDYGNDPNGVFQKVFQAQVVLNGGGDYLAGVTSAAVNGQSANGQTTSQSKFTVNFDLDSSYCKYPLSQTTQTLNRVKIQQLPTSNSNSIWDNPDFGIGCKGASPLSYVYSEKVIATTPESGQITCKVFASSACKADYENICANYVSQGYVLMDCDDSAQGWISGYTTTGRACVKVVPASTTADYVAATLSPKSDGFSAKVTVNRLASASKPAESEVISISSAGQTSGQTSDVIARFTYTGGSVNPDCETNSQWIFARTAGGQKGVVESYAFNNLAVGRYQAIQSATAKHGSFSGLVTSTTNYNYDVSHLALNTGLFDTTQYPNGYIVEDRISSPHVFPNIMLYVKADWLGIVEPLGVPQISQVTPSTISARPNVEASPAQVTISNAGASSTAANFNVWADCQPSLNLRWINNPNSQTISGGSSYPASFAVTTGSEGVYSCQMNAKQTVAAFGSQPVSVSTPFTVNSQKICDLTCNTPKVLDVQACTCTCSKTQADCAALGQSLDSQNCACVGVPPSTKCSDDTPINVCNFQTGKKCELQGTTPVLNDKAECHIGVCDDNGVCENLETTSNCPNDCHEVPPRECIPLIEKRVTSTTDSYDIKVAGVTLLSLGGTQTQGCETDWGVLLFGGCLTLVGIVAVIAVAFIVAKKKRR